MHTSREAGLKVRLLLLQVGYKLKLGCSLLGICNLLLHILVLPDQVCHACCLTAPMFLAYWLQLLHHIMQFCHFCMQS